MTRRVQIVVDGPYAQAFTPYEALEVLKGTVPSSMRSWSKGRKCWNVDTDFVPVLANALRQYGYTVFVTDGNGDPWPKSTPRPGRGSTPAPDWIEQAFAACPTVAVDKLRRGLMGVFHPDLATGSAALAQRINSAADRRKAAR